MNAYSRFCSAIPINLISEASKKIKEWMLAIESQTEKRVANLQTDEENQLSEKTFKHWGKESRYISIKNKDQKVIKWPYKQ